MTFKKKGEISLQWQKKRKKGIIFCTVVVFLSFNERIAAITKSPKGISAVFQNRTI